MSQDQILAFSPEKKLKTRAIYATASLAQLVVPKGVAEKGKLHARRRGWAVPRPSGETGQPVPTHLPPGPAAGKEEWTAGEGAQVPISERQAWRAWSSCPCWHLAVSEMFWGNHLAHRLRHQKDTGPVSYLPVPCRCLRYPRAFNMVLNTQVSNYIKPKRTLVAESSAYKLSLGSQ